MLNFILNTKDNMVHDYAIYIQHNQIISKSTKTYVARKKACVMDAEATHRSTRNILFYGELTNNIRQSYSKRSLSH